MFWPQVVVKVPYWVCDWFIETNEGSIEIGNVKLNNSNIKNWQKIFHTYLNLSILQIFQFKKISHLD